MLYLCNVYNVYNTIHLLQTSSFVLFISSKPPQPIKLNYVKAPKMDKTLINFNQFFPRKLCWPTTTKKNTHTNWLWLKIYLLYIVSLNFSPDYSLNSSFDRLPRCTNIYIYIYTNKNKNKLPRRYRFYCSLFVRRSFSSNLIPYLESRIINNISFRRAPFNARGTNRIYRDPFDHVYYIYIYMYIHSYIYSHRNEVFKWSMNGREELFVIDSENFQFIFCFLHFFAVLLRWCFIFDLYLFQSIRHRQVIHIRIYTRPFERRGGGG